jgi:DNA polymerase-1
MGRDTPLEPVADATPTWDKAAALAREWELKALSERLDQLAKAAG